MKKKIAIVTSGHPYYDERIFYKFGRSLNKNGYEVSIICSTVEADADLVKDDIHIMGFNGSSLKKSEKIRKFSGYLSKIKPDVIICSEPLPILASNKYKKSNKNIKIIYDVTEWYPENVAFKHSGFKILVTYVSSFIFNIYASNLVDAIIVGEQGKKRRYNLIAPFNPKIIISYYPVLEFFHYSQPGIDKKEFVLCYAGLLKFDRGIKQLLKIAQLISIRHKNLNVRLKFIGKFESSEEESEYISLIKEFPEFNVEICGWVEYPKISEKLGTAHLCFDFREKNFVYRNSLPIKIFEYMACGKPFIFTDIKPLRDEIEVDKCGFLVDPNNLEEIVGIVDKYITNNELLSKHSKNGRELIERKYNWEIESVKLLSLIKSLLETK